VRSKPEEMASLI